MQHLIRVITTVLFLNLLVLPSNACLWDYDTIEMEQQLFPSVLELIAGKFLRHSPELYYWRIKQRTVDLEQHPDSLALYDDLAVAYSKIGEHEKAIALMNQKEAIRPKMYTTYANIGTFYIFAGKLKKALAYIDKALEIDPNAHFGREIYQKYLVEYLLSKSKKGKITFPLDASFYAYPQMYFSDINEQNFYGFLLKKYAVEKKKSVKKLPEEELSKAIVGVMGMMKFANYNSPVLLEVLGDLLFNTGNRVAARHLASRAYLHASYQVEDKKSKETYRKRIAFLLSVQYANKKKEFIDIDKMETLLAKELEDGAAFYEQIRTDEINWIENGLDVDEMFAQKYYQEPEILTPSFRGLKHISAMKKKYLRDTSIGTRLDYRPIVVYTSETIDMNNKQLLDSLFERRLAMEIRKDSALLDTIPTDKEEVSNEPKKSGNTLIMVLIGLGIFVCIGIVLFKSRQNK